jgi:hypothetical protein
MRCKAKIGSKAERTRQYVSISNGFSTPQRAARAFFNSLLVCSGKQHGREPRDLPPKRLGLAGGADGKR